MRKTKKLATRGRAASAVVLAGLLLACPWRSQADSAYPGLPEPSFQPGAWGGVAQLGMSETAKARQWVAVPKVAASVWSGYSPTQLNPEPGVARRQTVFGDAFFISPPGAPAGYGYLPPLKVRTVGFGLLPAEATVRVSQRRSGGLPIPIHAQLVDDRLDSGVRKFHETVIEDAFEVEVIRVVVDGVDVGLTGGCRTVRPAPVRMIGPAYTVPAGVNIQDYLATIDPTTFYHPVYGGQLTGDVDIPPFTGCTTAAGDDLSPMITLSVSGPGNRVIFRTSLCDTEYSQGVPQPWPPGAYDAYDEANNRFCLLNHEPVPYPDRAGS